MAQPAVVQPAVVLDDSRELPVGLRCEVLCNAADIAGQLPCRMRGLMLLLTFSGLAVGELNFALLTALIYTYGRPIREFVICRELHANPARADRCWHYHIYMRSSTTEWDTTVRTFFSTVSNICGRILHPHVKKVRNTKGDRQRVIFYLMKQLHVCMKLDPVLGLDLSAIGRAAWIGALLAAKGAEAGMAALRRLAPQHFFLQGHKVLKNLQYDHKYQLEPKFKLTDFIRAPLDLSKPVVLHGGSGLGKTQFAIAHGLRPVLVRELEDLWEMTEETDIVIFDDFDFSQLSFTQTISLLDMETRGTIRCRYRNAHIPAEMPRIMTTNKSCNWALGTHIFTPGENPDQHAAIDRRFVQVHIAGPLFAAAPAAPPAHPAALPPPAPGPPGPPAVPGFLQIAG